jgi:hypothetical protein
MRYVPLHELDAGLEGLLPSLLNALTHNIANTVGIMANKRVDQQRLKKIQLAKFQIESRVLVRNTAEHGGPLRIGFIKLAED